MATHARLLDRRRFEVLTGGGDRAALLAALDAYRNGDGGFGYGLEPDLRSRTSQPGGALHAFEALADAAPATSPRAGELCDWCASFSRPDGGLPFAGSIPDPAGSAPFWANANPNVSSLQITSIVAAAAHRVAKFDRTVSTHPWLGQATRYCLAAIAGLGGSPNAMALAFSVQFLDLVHDAYPQAPELLDRLGQHVPDDGLVHVSGGKEDEYMRPLDFAPDPGPARRLFSDEVIEAELARLAADQQDDGGWRVDFGSFSPAAELEWRGHATVSAVAILRSNAQI